MYINIIHRDLKPGNILLTGQTFKLADFGCSLISSEKTLDYGYGTPGYSAPETLGPKHQSFEVLNTGYDDKSDWFSLGVILHEVSTRILPGDDIKLANGGSLKMVRKCRGDCEIKLEMPTNIDNEVKNAIQKLTRAHPYCRILSHRDIKNTKPTRDFDWSKL
jgi:serine/threonine protein kinase